MKRLFITVILLAISTHVYSQNYWQRVSSPASKTLFDCFFLDTTYGWAIGDSGTIVHTSNGGQSWQLQNSGITTYAIEDIFFTGMTDGWAIANDYTFVGSIILRTTNLGQNWVLTRFPDSNAVLNTIAFLNAQTGYTAGFSGEIFRTTNGGVNWIKSIVDTAYCAPLYLFPKKDITFLDANTGFACGGQIDIQGMVWRTIDAGLTWQTYCLTPEPLEDVVPISSTKIISSGGDFEYGAITSTSYDGGHTWEYYPTNIFGVAECMAFRTPSEVWIPLTFAQKWAVSLDTAGMSSPWIEIDTPDSLLVYSAIFKSPTFGWGFGTKGSILKYNKDIIGLSDPASNVPVKHKLFQNHPNPFNPSTIISYELSKTEFVRFFVYDLSGRLVKTFVEGFRPQGENKFKFNGHGLASGVYIYKLQAGEMTETKKMVLIK